MDFISVVVLAVALAMDCFSVSLANGTRMPVMKLFPVLELAFFMGLFQALMPVAGWLLGNSFLQMMEAFDHWIAFGLLLFLGLKMCIDALRPEKTENKEPFRQSFGQVMLMSVATSIDALAVGISFSVIRVQIAVPVVVIGLVSFIFSLAGSCIGYRFGQIRRINARLVGGLMLIAIGVKILLSHLTANGAF